MSTEADKKILQSQRALSDIGDDVASALFSPHQISGVLDLTQQMQDLWQLTI